MTKSFHCPENYEKIKDLPNGKELWAGANDWECGWTWAGIHAAGGDKDSEPEQWLNVDHNSCPGCHGTCDCCGKKETRQCQEFAKNLVYQWAKKHSKQND